MFLYLIFNKMTIWVLKDDRIGSSKQAEFLAKKLEKSYGYNNISWKQISRNIRISEEILRKAKQKTCKVDINTKSEFIIQKF